MKRIPLTQGKYAIVDDDDYEELKQYKWYAHKKSGKYYAARNIKQNDQFKKVFMHRVIMGVLPNIHIDHINGNGLDNRKCNLRICDASQNAANQKPQVNKSSKYKGVRWYSPLKKWRAQIWHNNKSIHLGYYQDEAKAAQAYNKKAAELFGKFARLNNDC